MKPIFTIHAGEYLVATEIEKFRNYNVWLPGKDTGIDLLITNNTNTKATSLQVKYSKDFSTTYIKNKIFRQDIKSVGWWTLNKAKIEKSKANFWIFVLYSLKEKTQDFIIIKPLELLKIFNNTNRTANLIHCYITVTNHDPANAYETRGLNDKDIQQICKNCYKDKNRDLTVYLDNWKQITEKLM